VCVTNFVAANESHSAAGADLNVTSVDDKLPAEDKAERENVDNFYQEHNFATAIDDVMDAVRVAEHKVTDDGAVDMLDHPDQPGDQDCYHLRPPSASHISPEVPDILKVADVTCSSERGDTGECCNDGRRPSSEGAVVSKSACSKGRARPLPSLKFSADVPDILKIIDDACVRQDDTDYRNDRESLSEAVDASKSDTCSIGVKKHAMHSLNSVRLNGRSEAVMDISTPEPGQSLQKSRSEAIKIRVVPRKKSQTIVATPGHAGKMVLASQRCMGKLRRTTSGRAGKMVLTSPPRARNLKHVTSVCAVNPKQTTPIRADKIVHTSPGHTGNLRHATAGHADDLKLTSPGHVSKTVITSPGNLRHATPAGGGNLKQTTPGRAGNKRRAITPGGLATPRSGLWAKDQAGALNPNIARQSVGSPALKRNAKGETALHRAAIKVISLDDLFLVFVK